MLQLKHLISISWRIKWFERSLLQWVFWQWGWGNESQRYELSVSTLQIHSTWSKSKLYHLHLRLKEEWRINQRHRLLIQ